MAVLASSPTSSGSAQSSSLSTSAFSPEQSESQLVLFHVLLPEIATAVSLRQKPALSPTHNQRSIGERSTLALTSITYGPIYSSVVPCFSAPSHLSYWRWSIPQSITGLLRSSRLTAADLDGCNAYCSKVSHVTLLSLPQTFICSCVDNHERNWLMRAMSNRTKRHRCVEQTCILSKDCAHTDPGIIILVTVYLPNYFEAGMKTSFPENL